MKPNLSEFEFLFIDCQTTGMRPTTGHLLELAWSLQTAAPFNKETLQAHLIRLPEGHDVPRQVTEITGLTTAQANTGTRLNEVFKQFSETIGDQPRLALIHYAQFERAFLEDLFKRETGEKSLPFQILCTQQLTKRLFPNLPSQNIRAAAGYFGANIDGIKRAGSHVQATHQIWQGLAPELARLGLEDPAQLSAWLKDKPKAKPVRYEYRLEKIKRLDLPDKPGVYRMLSKSGEVLYVGKATSLKSRVNSYFRGKKGRDTRKLEMLAQVWDLQVTGCETPLEAALLESDEIKRLNPPYNVVLKRGRRHLVFYNHDFTKCQSEPTQVFNHGPFRNHNWIENLNGIVRSLNRGSFEQVFYDVIPEELLKQGFAFFCESEKLKPEDLRKVRSLLCLGLKISRREVIAEDEDEEEETELTAEDVVGKFSRLLLRAANEWRRARRMTKLLNAQITLNLKTGARQLNFTNGRLSPKDPPAQEAPWRGLKIDDFDRMSILLSELGKYDHSIK